MKAQVGERIEKGTLWISKRDGKTVFRVLECKPFGVLEVQKEGTWQFGRTTTKRLRENFRAVKVASG